MIDDKFEILMIDYNGFKNKWVNPDISSMVNLDKETGYDNNCHRVFFRDKDNELLVHLIVQSELLDKFWSQYYTDIDENDQAFPVPKQKDVNKIVKTILMRSEVMLLEDVWIPGGEQFCFTVIGQEVGELMKKVKKIRFSPDCAITTDGKTFWFDT